MQFASAGFSVMPVGKDKKPLLKSWKQYQKTPATDEEIEKWWSMWPEANIGIITGEVSGISVIDIDTKGLEAPPTPVSMFPETFTVQTPSGGFHLYYRHVPGLSISANAYEKFPGVDIRSDGGFVVGPYSSLDYKDKDGKRKTGDYQVVKNIQRVAFPSSLFPAKRARRSMSSMIGVGSGGRNDSITSFIGKLLQASKEEEWLNEVWPAVIRANKTYSPPLPENELKRTFESILGKEKERRSTMQISNMRVEDGEIVEDQDAPEVAIRIRKNKQGTAYKDMANVLAVLEQHPFYKGSLRYNEFKQDIEYNGRPFEESDLVKIQFFMQTTAELHSVTADAIHAAIKHCAYKNAYDEAKEWLTSIEWDGKERLHNWINKAAGTPDDEYHSGIGAHWFMGMIRRIMEPGCTFDYVLLLVGPQGIGKTSFFRILGGPWYKSYTGAMDNKDFYLSLRGAMIVDLDEGAAMYKSEAIKIKSIITETHDEFRAPYDRVMKRYPRRFVFSMSTNDTEPFRDMTGNRRYWVIDAEDTIDFKWLEENRDQLFAETYHYWKNKTKIPDVPFDIALETQDRHLPDDSWADLIIDEVQKSPDYCRGDLEFATTITDVYSKIFPQESIARLGKAQEMRVATVFKKDLGLEKRRHMVDGERKVRWMLTHKKAKALQEKPVKDTRDAFDMHGAEDKDDESS